MYMICSNQREQDELAVSARILRSSSLFTHMVRARGVTCYMRSVIQPLLNNIPICSGDILLGAA